MDVIVSMPTPHPRPRALSPSASLCLSTCLSLCLSTCLSLSFSISVILSMISLPFSFSLYRKTRLLPWASETRSPEWGLSTVPTRLFPPSRTARKIFSPVAAENGKYCWIILLSMPVLGFGHCFGYFFPGRVVRKRFRYRFFTHARDLCVCLCFVFFIRPTRTAAHAPRGKIQEFSRGAHEYFKDNALRTRFSFIVNIFLSS